MQKINKNLSKNPDSSIGCVCATHDKSFLSKNKVRGSIMMKIFILPIRFYQVCISPFLPRSCRYYPSCSEYAVIAIKKYGIIRGLFMALRRILRCHPIKCLGGGSGYDPVR